MPLTALDYSTEALQELAVVGAVDPPSPEDAAFMLRIMNRIFDDWNADKKGVYAWDFLSFVLTPNLDPHTIGPTGTFVMSARPQQIYDANLILNNVTPNVNTKMRLRDAAWWADQSVQALTTNYPTDLFYDPQWPDGVLHFWPAPTYAWGVQFQIPIVLAEATLPTVISLPPGYHAALVLTMAEEAAPAMKVDLSPITAIKARRARARIFDANDESFPLATRDSGMPSSGESGNRTIFNYHSRTWGN